MKKIFLYFSIIATAVACTSESLEKDVTPMVTETISGTYGLSTKATIADADASFKWSEGDNLAIHVSNGDSHKYVFTSGKGGASAAAASASFSVTYDSGYSRDAFAVYPSTIVSECATAETNYGQSGSQLDVTLPSSYFLSQVQGEVSPCPMVATNTAGDGWTFYQLCSLLRLTVNDIPAGAKRLEIDFDGKQVWGDFSIAAGITPGASVISTTDDADHDIITITKDGSDAVLGQTSLTVNIPLPVGTYSRITVNAYDAISGGNVVSFDQEDFNYPADNTKAAKKSTSLTDQSIFTFTFRDADTPNKDELGNLRFVRIFSCQNKLYNGSTTFGPYTVSSATGEADMANHVEASLKFGPNDGDQLAFQVIDANGKVYAGLYPAPTGGFAIGSYDLTVDVKAYTFTVETNGKKVYFSPGDLGVDSGVYSFTEPFTTWAHGNTTVYTSSPYGPTQRVWFDQYYDNAVITGGSVYGITGWRSPIRSTTSFPSVGTPYEWNNLVHRPNMNSGVNPYYKVSIPGYQYCLLLPPDETQSADIGEDLTAGEVTDYAKYIGKGFVLLFNTNRATYDSKKNKFSWGGATDAKQGFYWAIYNSSNRYYFTWPDAGPAVDLGASRMRNHIRYVRNVQ